MDKGTLTRTLIASSVAGAGLTLGGIGLAGAADNTDADRDKDGRHAAIAADLAEALGVSEDKVESALEAVRDDVPKPERDGTPPTDEEREAHRTAFAAALAEELGIAEDTVTAALEKLHEERQAEGRESLSERLDAAVDDGTLTEADKASVLKAYDADVIGGHHGGPGGR